MPDYTFDVINDKDLEFLVRDLLQAELGVFIESFKSGRDQGIDLRYSTAATPSTATIVQVKHWSSSGVTRLIRHLESSEAPKVKKLNPGCYILATSVGLNPQNKKDIKSIFSPYIKSTKDILGRDDLNNLLGRHSEIEKAHFKLWLSSTAVLQNIMNNAVTSRSDFVQSEITQKASLFVPTTNLQTAIDILNQKHVLLIKGVPGVGKTTLAEFLIYRMLADGFKLVVIDEHIRDGEENFIPGKRQVFYFDDFLGSNYLELFHSRGSGSNISRFIDRIARDKRKRMILTTRTTILNQAYRQMHQLGEQKLNRSDFELHLDDYSRYDRARILYNHIFFRKLPAKYADHIFEDENYLKVIDHDNYNPRVIEFITDPHRLEDVSEEDYLDFVQTNLDNPEAIWQAAYDHQIDSNARLLLDTLFSLGDVVEGETLRLAFEARLDYEIEHHGYQKCNNAFLNAVRLLLGGFIIHSKEYGEDGLYSFVNPSIVDFLIARYSQDPTEKWRILESSIYRIQLERRFGTKKSSPILIQESEVPRFLKVIQDYSAFLCGDQDSSPKIRVIHLLVKTSDWPSILGIVETMVENISFNYILGSDRAILLKVLKSAKKDRNAWQLFSKKRKKIIRAILSTSKTPEESEESISLMSDFGMNYDAWIRKGKNQEFMYEALDEMWEAYSWDLANLDGRLLEAMSMTEADETLGEIKADARYLYETLSLEPPTHIEAFDNVDLHEIVDENVANVAAEDYEAEAAGDFIQPGYGSELQKITELFGR